MLRTRVIPVLLIRDSGLVKGTKFKQHRYVGDPMNAIRIFNDLQADEVIILDIEASAQGRCIDPNFVELIASEARMPVAVGGGISNLDQARNLLKAGAEKLILCTTLYQKPELLTAISGKFGAQAVVACIDYKKTWLGKLECYSLSGSKSQKTTPDDLALQVEKLGAGEIMLNCIDRDGSYEGYDIETLKRIAHSVSIPVIAGCGSKDLADFEQAVKVGGASAVAAGSQFVFHGPRRAVLISFPERARIDGLLSPQ